MLPDIVLGNIHFLLACYVTSRGIITIWRCMMEKQITVGELAKQAHITVRTLQYYDKIGLLKPTSMSKGGRRLYGIHNITILHQIITLKSLGLTLEEIKKRIVPINTNEDISRMLSKQSDLIKEQISKANKILDSIEMITSDIEDSNTIDWSKYSNMVKLIQDNNESFWVVRFLDDNVLENITQVHEQYSEEELPSDWLVKCMRKAKHLFNSGLTPDSDEAQKLAHEMWTMVEKYSNGEPEMIMKLYSFYSVSEQWPKEYSIIQKETKTFLEKSIELYIGTHIVRQITEEKDGE